MSWQFLFTASVVIPIVVLFVVHERVMRRRDLRKIEAMYENQRWGGR